MCEMNSFGCLRKTLGSLKKKKLLEDKTKQMKIIDVALRRLC